MGSYQVQPCFKLAWSLYEVASGVQDKEENVESPPSYMLLGIMIWIEDKSILQTIIAKFDEDCTKKTNIIVERCQFLKRKQETSGNL